MPHFTLLLLALLLSACSHTQLLSKQDYQKSQIQFVQNNVDDAALSFPRQAESGNFITTVEKTYLNLIQGKAQIKALQQQVEILEDRVRFHVSREAKSFFYLQTPEDYYAAEHEVIWMHLLLSWGYSLQGKYEQGCVEARIASSLLSLPWSPQGHFDDPTLRLLLGGLWAMCGDWKEAQVDFRAAWYMDKRLDWVLELADRPAPPAHLLLVLGGPGPEVEWTPELTLNPLRSQRQVSFRLRGKKSSLRVTDAAGQSLRMHLSPDASPWYARHLERESELHELILDSAFGGKTAGSGAIAGGKIAAKTGLGLLVGIGGTALGAAIAHTGLQSNSEDLFRVGLVTIAASVAWGGEIISEGYHSSVKEFKQDVDPSQYYRYVRYLPEYLWCGWSEQGLELPLQIRSAAGEQIQLMQSLSADKPAVSIGFLPDSTVQSQIRHWR